MQRNLLDYKKSSKTCKVTPCTGAWIETDKCVSFYYNYGVAMGSTGQESITGTPNLQAALAYLIKHKIEDYSR